MTDTTYDNSTELDPRIAARLKRDAKGLVAAVAVCALRARHPYWLTVALLVLAELVMVAGYFVTEWLLLGYGLAAAAGAVVPNLVQGFSGVVLGAMLIPLLRRVTPPAMRL